MRIGGHRPAVADAETAGRHVEALRACRPVVAWRHGQAVEAQPGAAVHHLHAPAGGEPQARLQPEADDVGRPAAVRGGRDARRAGRAHHLHADGLGRARRTRRWPRRGTSSRRATEPPTSSPRDAATGPRPERRPGGARGDPAHVVRSRTGGDGRLARPRRGTTLPADLAARPGEPDGREAARDDHRGSRGRGGTTCAPRRRGRCSTASAASTPRAATRARRRPSARSRRCSVGDVTRVPTVTPTQHFTEPPPRFTEATLDQGARGARDRSSVNLRRHDLHDRRSRLRRDPRASPLPGAGGRDRHGPARGALRRVRGSRVHRPYGGGARRGRPWRARLGPPAARVLRSAAGARGREAEGASAEGLHHGPDRRDRAPRATRW